MEMIRIWTLWGAGGSALPEGWICSPSGAVPGCPLLPQASTQSGGPPCVSHLFSRRFPGQGKDPAVARVPARGPCSRPLLPAASGSLGSGSDQAQIPTSASQLLHCHKPRNNQVAKTQGTHPPQGRKLRSKCWLSPSLPSWLWSPGCLPWSPCTCPDPSLSVPVSSLLLETVMADCRLHSAPPPLPIHWDPARSSRGPGIWKTLLALEWARVAGVTELLSLRRQHAGPLGRTQGLHTAVPLAP